MDSCVVFLLGYTFVLPAKEWWKRQCGKGRAEISSDFNVNFLRARKSYCQSYFKPAIPLFNQLSFPFSQSANRHNPPCASPGRCFRCAKVRRSGSCKAQFRGGQLPPCIRSRLSALILHMKTSPCGRVQARRQGRNKKCNIKTWNDETDYLVE